MPLNDKHDPVYRLEEMVKKLHDKAGTFTSPVLSRYPITFALLLAFSGAAILHGFELFADQIPLFVEHPTILMGVGVLALILTGALYRVLGRMG